MSETLSCPDCDQKVTVKPGKSAVTCPACGGRWAVESESAGGKGRRDDRDDRPRPKRKYRKDWDDDDDDDDRPPPKPKRSLAWLWILLGVLAFLFAGCGGVTWWAYSTAKKVKDDFVQKVENNPWGVNPDGRGKAPRQPDASTYPRQKPFDVDPRLLKGDATVYLADLAPFDVRQGGWKFGRNGAMGADDDRWVVVGKTYYDHAIAMHPPDRGVARASFALGGQARRLKGSVALNDEWHGHDAWGPVTFAVYKDGEEVWRSPPTQRRNVTLAFDLDVSGARVITLETKATDSSHDAHCVWLDPVLER